MANSHITDFIQSLNPEEVKIVKEYVYKSDERTSSNGNKIGKLLDILVNNPNKQYGDKNLSYLLGSKTGALRVLKSRLFEKAKEALVFDKHFENHSIFNHREKIVFTLKKKILLAKSLYRVLNQRRLETINLLISETIKIAKENQVYDVLMETLILQKHIKGLRVGLEEYEKITNEIQFYDYCFKAVQNSYDLYYKLVLNEWFINSLTEDEVQDHMNKSIKQMEVDYRKTKAEEVNYFLNTFKAVVCEKNKNFSQAIACYKKIVALVKKSPILFSKNRIGFAILNISQLYVFIGNYKDALVNIKHAQKFHIINSFNYLNLLEMEFYIYWYAKNYGEASMAIEQMLAHLLIDTGEFRKSKFIFYQSCLSFASKQFKDALQLLNKSLKIEKDKTGWNIALRILMTMIFIESNKTGEASTSLATLNKYVERTNKTKKVTERDILILKLLRELEKDGFKRNEKNKTALKLLAELSDKNKPTAWNYFTPELIPFHEWVKTLPEKVIAQKKILKA